MSEEFRGRVMGDVMGGFGAMVLYIGMETGVWAAMDPRTGAKPATSNQIADKVGLDRRYVEELLRAASVHDYLDYVPGSPDAASGRYSGVPADSGTFALPAAHAPDAASERYSGVPADSGTFALPAAHDKGTDKGPDGASERYSGVPADSGTFALPAAHDKGTDKGPDSASERYSGVPADSGTFALPAAHAPVLCDKGTAAFVGGPLGTLPRMAGNGTIPLVIDAFRSGEGVPFSRYGPEFVEYSCRSYAREFEFDYGPDWMQRKEVGDIRAKLLEGGKTVLDIGSGSGISSISLAKQFPGNRVLSTDPDVTSYNRTKENIAAAESEGRVVPGEVTAHCCYAEDTDCGPADLITIFRVVHDLVDPVSLLKNSKGLLAAHSAACVLVYEQPAPDTFADALTSQWKASCRAGYTKSLMHCLPVSMADAGDRKSAAIGTMVSEATMKKLALGAGFSSCATVVKGPRGYLYRLNP